MEVTCEENEVKSSNNETGDVKVSFSGSVQSLSGMTEDLSSSQSLLSVAGNGRYPFGLGGQKLNILRSPSRESVGTDISLFSVSTLASELTNRMKFLSVRTPCDISRGPSPNFELKKKRPENIKEVWFEEQTDMIKGMAALSSAAGLTKSFSTSDIINLPPNSGFATEEDSATPGGTSLFLLNTKRNAVSEMALNNMQNCGYLLDHNITFNVSRSCSTWVAAGDISSASQLPSPHGGTVTTNSRPSFTPALSPADLIRSVNKTVRQHYIRRRLLNTYKALERLSQSEFNLDKLEVEAAASAKNSEKQSLNIRADSSSRRGASNRLSVPGSQTSLKQQKWNSSSNTTVPNSSQCKSSTSNKLTVIDVERERGQPLSKYDRNIMIFNWLLTLEHDDENAAE